MLSFFSYKSEKTFHMIDQKIVENGETNELVKELGSDYGRVVFGDKID